MTYRIPDRNVAGDQLLASEQPGGAGTDHYPVHAMRGMTWADVSAQITAAQPLPGTTVAGGTVGGAADYSAANNIGVILSGTHTAAGSVLIFEVSKDGTTWIQVPVQDETTNVSLLSYTVQVTTARAFTCSLGGMSRFRVRCITFVTNSNPTVTIDPGTLAFEPIVSAVAANPAGTTLVSFNTAAAGVGQATVTEALNTMVSQRDLTAIGTATTFTVPAGKTFRILGMTSWARNGAATATMMQTNLRAIKTGTITATTGGILIPLLIPLPNTAGSTNRDSYTPGASYIELQSGWSWGVSSVLGVASASTIVGVSLYGIEY